MQANNINQTNVNHQIERIVPVRHNVYGDNISFEDVNVNLSSLIGIEGYWYGTNNIVFDINEQFEKEVREYITLILKEYDVNPFLEIALFHDDVVTPNSISTNAELEICLKAGEEYFICTKPSNVYNDIECYAVNIMRMRTISGDTELLSYPAQYTYTINTGNNHPYLCLKIRPKVTGTYRFEMTGTYAYNYVMSLWGNSYSFIKFNSNSSSGIPYITHTLYSSNVYYVFIEQESLMGYLSSNFIVTKV